MDEVKSIGELIVRLGGPKQAAEQLTEKIGNLRAWKSRGYLPSRLFEKHTDILADLGIKASSSIWRQAAAPDGHSSLREAS